MSTRHQDIPQDAAQELAIANYLRDHPQFFVDHATVLADIHVPHTTEGTISLIERQVAVLREQNQELKHQLHSLVQVARDNDRLNDQMHRLTLALMEATDLSTTLKILDDSLHDDFRADALVLGLFGLEDHLPNFNNQGRLSLLSLSDKDIGTSAFSSLLATGKPLCGHLRPAETAFLFGTPLYDKAASAVVLALFVRGMNKSRAKPLGLLGIGSGDPKRYHPAMGTLFLSYLGELISQAIGRYLPRH